MSVNCRNHQLFPISTFTTYVAFICEWLRWFSHQNWNYQYTR